MPKVIKDKPTSKRQSVKTLLTIESDLGDAIFSDDVALICTLLAPHSQGSPITFREVSWKPGMRSLAVDLVVPPSHPATPLQLQVQAKAAYIDSRNVEKGFLHMPVVVPITSPIIDLRNEIMVAERRVERPIPLLHDGCVRIWEDVGDSIARHVWDAGISLVTVLDYTCCRVSLGLSNLDNLLLQANNGRQLNVLELGAGCGLVGVAFTKLVPNTRTLITDVAEVEELVRRNISSNKPARGSEVDFQVLDWTAPVPPNIRQRRHDLVLIADCIYNETSIPALVNTISSLASTASEAVFVVATKTRHSSEVMFFDLMAAAGFAIKTQAYVIAPMDYLFTVEDMSCAERVDFYEFQLIST